jgi:hypothetical protein
MTTTSHRWRSVATLVAGVLVAAVLMALMAVVTAPKAKADAPNYLQLLSLKAVDLNDPSWLPIWPPQPDLPPDEIELWVFNGDVDQNLTADRRLVFDLADLQMRDLRYIPEIPIPAGDNGEAEIRLKEFDWWGGYDQLGTQKVGTPDGEVKTIVFDNAPWNDTKYELRYRVHHGQVSTVIDSGPSGRVNTNSATFGFHATAPYVTFEGSLDGAPWGPATSPKTYSNLADGDHNFRVRAIDGGGSVFAESSRTWAVDTTRPTVAKVSPANQASRIPRWTNVVATFSEEMNRATLTRANVKLYKMTASGPTQVTNATVKPNLDGRKVTLNPYGTSTTMLARQTRYKAIVTTGVGDLSGNTTGQSKVWYFTTSS